MKATPSSSSSSFIFYFYFFLILVIDRLAVAIMNVIVQIQDPPTNIQIQVGNAVCLLRPCSMFLLGTELSFGKLHIRFSSILYVCRNVEILGF